MATLLNEFVDADEWEAEDIVGRLGIVLHAAFLFAGFQPYSAQPPSDHVLKQSGESGNSSLCLSRWYTAPELTRCKRADAAVLILCAQGRDVALVVFLTTDRDMEMVYLERLDLATAMPLLSRSLGGVEPWGSRICRSLADRVCWGFLDELCRKNSLPLTSFMSLPDDLKLDILKRLADGKDLARVECVSTQLRLLVVENDGELWKPLFEALPVRQPRSLWDLWYFWLSFGKSSVKKVISWKDEYVDARPRPCSRMWRTWFPDTFDVIPDICFFTDFSPYPVDWHCLHNLPEQEKVSTRGERTGGRRRKVAMNGYRKEQGPGAVHSPSSRYRWRHR